MSYKSVYLHPIVTRYLHSKLTHPDAQIRAQVLFFLLGFVSLLLVEDVRLGDNAAFDRLCDGLLHGPLVVVRHEG
jgi:hypothetical protein